VWKVRWPFSRGRRHATAPRGERRRSRRQPIPSVLVAVETPRNGADAYVAAAVDINADGIGLVLPPEIHAGDEVLLTFELDPELTFERLPSTVVRGASAGAGAIGFRRWPVDERLRLVGHLALRWTENGAPSPVPG
jgi:hypothetical protein